MIEPEPNMDQRGPQLTIASVIYSAIFSEACIEFKLMLGAWLMAFPSLQSAVLFVLAVVCAAFSSTALGLFEGRTALAALATELYEAPQKAWMRREYPDDGALLKLGYFQQQFRGTGMHADQAGKLYFLTPADSSPVDLRCVFNPFGPTFILFPHADIMDPDMPLAEKFLLYHELAHGNFEGGSSWLMPRITIVSVVLTSAFFLYSTSPSFWYLLATFLFVCFGFFRSMDLFKRASAEVFADRFAIRVLASESVSDAIAIAEYFHSNWTGTLRCKNEHLTWVHRKITEHRLQAMSVTLSNLKRVTDNKIEFRPVIPGSNRQIYIVYAVSLLYAILGYFGFREDEISSVNYQLLVLMGILFTGLHYFGRSNFAAIIASRRAILERTDGKADERRA
ncbi:hypothetical protein [Mesorhizobium sp. M0767]|uniref:hypothetical protein n=1 Tax=Mesorhizobium sp. M0767 TaxID=2956995 RepID=UPI003339B640